MIKLGCMRWEVTTRLAKLIREVMKIQMIDPRLCKYLTKLWRVPWWRSTEIRSVPSLSNRHHRSGNRCCIKFCNSKLGVAVIIKVTSSTCYRPAMSKRQFKLESQRKCVFKWKIKSNYLLVCGFLYFLIRRSLLLTVIEKTVHYHTIPHEDSDIKWDITKAR